MRDNVSAMVERQKQFFAVRWDDAVWKEQLRQLFYSGVQRRG